MEPEGSLYVHKNPPLDPLLSHMNPVHNFLFCFGKIHFNIILSSTFMPPWWSVPFRFSD